MLQLTTIIFLISASVFATLHFISLELYLYWKYLWLDMPVHVLGGSIVALSVFTARDLRIIKNTHIKLGPVIVFVLIVALFWEVFGIYVGKPIENDFIFDTVSDIGLGVMGGLIGYFIGTKISALK